MGPRASSFFLPAIALPHLSIITQLEPCPNPDQDPFQRSVRPRQPDSVFVEGDTDAVKSYEIDRIVSHTNTRQRGIEFPVRWKGQGPEFDEWRNAP